MATANLLLDKRNITSKGYPIKIQIYHAGKQHVVSCRMYATDDDFNKALSTTKKTNLVSKLRIDLDRKKTQAEAILDRLGGTFTLDRFRKMFDSEIDYSSKSNRLKLKNLYAEYISTLKDNNQYKSVSSYTSSMKSFLGFAGNVDLQSISVDTIKKYERYMLDKSKSISTVYTYLRPLRAIYNKAIHDGLIGEELFPFGGRGKYSIGSSISSKKFIDQDDVKSFWNYTAENEAQQRAKDYWFFIYFCNGISPVDLANLTSANIVRDAIIFNRQKTLTSKTVVKSITAYMRNEMIDIIGRQGNVKPAPFIFPVLKAGLSSEERLNTMEAWRRSTNKILNRIGKKIKISTSLCLYSARHSYGYVMKINNVAAHIVKDNLGHSTDNQASNYMGSIPMNNIKEISDYTTKFKN